MKYRLIFILIVLFLCRGRAVAGLLINEAACGTSSDWVELRFDSETADCMDISGLYVTMYYGTNEPLASQPVTIWASDRPGTPYDDRFVVVHLAEPGVPDETDATGDTNRNGYIDLYCDNYYAGLWNSDGVVSIDTDDDPANGGILDFVAYSDMDGTPNSTIMAYVMSAAGAGEWTAPGDDPQENCVDIGRNGLEEWMSISRKSGPDTNTGADFVVTGYQTPGRENITRTQKAPGRLFRLLRKKLLVKACCRSPQGVPVFVYEPCSIRFRIFSAAGLLVYESPMFPAVQPGYFTIPFEWRRLRMCVRTGLYPGLVEGASSRLHRADSDIVYIIMAGKR